MADPHWEPVEPIPEPGPGEPPRPRWPLYPSALRVLVVGGSFDPPHRGHTELAERAAGELARASPGGGNFFDILYVPAAWSPLKSGAPPTPAHHRVAMLRLAAGPGAFVWEDEIRRFEVTGGPSYTVDTLRRLWASRCINHLSLYLLMGADQALQFHRWREHRAILELARPVVLLREPCRTPESLRAALLHTGAWTPEEARRWAAWCVPGVEQIDVSSTAIRTAIAAGARPQDVPGLHPDVAEYIEEHGLYR